ncbi:MAG: hypothetical protein ACPGWR_28565 [Ardenticatenaceae bacterium]
MFLYTQFPLLRWDKIVSALKQAAKLLQQENYRLEYDEMKWSYVYPAIAERELAYKPVGRFRSPYLNWNKVVWAIEQAANLLLKDDYVAEHHEVKKRYLADAIDMRDSYLFLTGNATPKEAPSISWLAYKRPHSIISTSNRRKLLQKALVGSAPSCP